MHWRNRNCSATGFIWYRDLSMHLPGLSHDTLKELHGKLIKLKTAKSPFPKKVRGEALALAVREGKEWRFIAMIPR